MSERVLIRELQFEEVKTLKGFTPDDWNVEFDAFCYSHFGKPYFLPLVLSQEHEILATAQAFLNSHIGWAMFIIVRPKNQKKGLGRRITTHLIDLMFKKCSSIILIATKEGEVLYQKLGFKVAETYSFFEYQKINTQDYSNIFPFSAKDEKEVLQLDNLATNEERGFLVKPHLDKAFVYKTYAGKIEGFFIEGFEDGPIIASSEAAGKNLLTFKHSRGNYRTVLPNSNTAGINHLKSLGLKIKSEANRMHLGKTFTWKPQYVYSRIAGYCG